ncbi:MAG: hypothetical protein Q8K82_18505 [Gemmatimonadaceae bacterium]|nr:hypothetical protein [Gemmatimonadaceae bacterium]
MAPTIAFSRVAFVLVVSFFSAAVTNAQTLGCVSGGPGGAIPPSGSGGGGSYPNYLPTSELALPLAVATLPTGSTCVTEVRLLGLTHSYIGDVQFVLMDPSGTNYNLLCRVGSFTCDYSGDYTILRQCQGANAYPAACTGTSVLAPGSYDQVFYYWGDGELNIWNTWLDSIPAAAGTWTLKVYDWAAADVGSLSGWEICFGTPAPWSAPASAPTQIQPVDTCVSSDPPTLEWSEVACASSYDIDVDGAITSGVQGTSLSVPLIAGNHSWRVRGVNSWATGAWSPLAWFDVPLPPAVGACASGGPGGTWPVSGSDGTWPYILPSGQLDSPMAVTVPAGASKIVAVKIVGLSTLYIGLQQFVLEDPLGGMHNVFHRAGHPSTYYGLSCDALGGDYTFVEVGAYACPNPVTCSAINSSVFAPGIYEQSFGDWPNGAASILNTPYSSIPVMSGTYTLHCFEWDLSAIISGQIAGWELCFDPPGAPVPYCAPGGSSSNNQCVGAVSATANPNVAHSNSCIVLASKLETGQSGLIFYGLGTSQTSWCLGGNSVLCVKSPLERSGVQSTGGGSQTCSGTLVLDWNAYQLASPGVLGQPWVAGSKAYVQGWYRDPLSCKTTVLTSALELTYVP